MLCLVYIIISLVSIIGIASSLIDFIMDQISNFLFKLVNTIANYITFCVTNEFVKRVLFEGDSLKNSHNKTASKTPKSVKNCSTFTGENKKGTLKIIKTKYHQDELNAIMNDVIFNTSKKCVDKLSSINVYKSKILSKIKIHNQRIEFITSKLFENEDLSAEAHPLTKDNSLLLIKNMNQLNNMNRELSEVFYNLKRLEYHFKVKIFAKTGSQLVSP